MESKSNSSNSYRKLLYQMPICYQETYLFFVLLLLPLCSCYSIPNNNSRAETLVYNATFSNKSKVETFVQTDKIANTADIPQQAVVSSCKAFIDKFSEVASKFTKCSIKFSRPVRFCEYCVDHYMSAKSIYSTIMEGTVKDGANNPCSRTVLNSDRIQIIVQTSQFIDKIWTDGHCMNCFDVFDTIETNVSYKIANDTHQFYELVNSTWNCFRTYSQAEVIPYQPGNDTRNVTVCKNCHKYYHDTNIFYEHLAQKYSNLVCMDVVDSMNYTRIMWSTTFQCSRTKEDVVGVLILSGLFGSIPVIFYVTSKIYGSRMEHRILEQKRLNNDQRASTSRQS